MLEAMGRRVSKLKYYKTAILVVFSFLFGCMLTINLTPIDKTCRIEDSDREYNIMQNSKLKNPDLIILILSAPKNLDRRNVIRQTWLQLVDTNAEDENIKFKMKHYFVIGSLGLSVDDILHLTSEQSQFSDILILPMYDSYENLTMKVVKSFEWLDEQFDYGLGFRYVLKCDDDSFVRLDKLSTEIANVELIYLKSDLKYVKSLAENDASPFIRSNVQINRDGTKNELQLYWGYFHGSAKIKTAGKWKEPNWITCDRYVPYALGGGYILSKKLISFIAKNRDSFRQYNSEDVSVGAWLAPVTNILRLHDIRFDTEWTTRGCQNFYLITHNISKEEMHKMYDNILTTNNLCSATSIKRRHYFYNWAVPPSQCCNLKEKEKT
ncbi:beta-1,3-galactosyltransferase 6 [Tribolium castaneum]|uniref:beta-1,3-galactosyltransferase 6 n=1 Tax=Tribolium castaneum TaxID=7070 RepID=UPI0000D56167|nr:PREDICTED: beta-1,3-galactosyltransferase 6 [Tribolium castaneum]|eukprot:XP_968057.1 PREDICTED: beta-1,3-galactosyltransferase 6 [Tribolium castaneum]